MEIKKSAMYRYLKKQANWTIRFPKPSCKRLKPFWTSSSKKRNLVDHCGLEQGLKLLSELLHFRGDDSPAVWRFSVQLVVGLVVIFGFVKGRCGAISVTMSVFKVTLSLL